MQLTIEEATGTDNVIDMWHIKEYLESLKIKGVKEVSIVDSYNKIVASTNPASVGRVLTEEEQTFYGSKTQGGQGP